jgi:hypothetical protein
MSQICIRGLVGDSSITNFVRPGMRAFCTALHFYTDARVSLSTSLLGGAHGHNKSGF